MSSEVTDLELSRKFKAQLDKGLFLSIFYIFCLIPIWGAFSLFLFLKLHHSKFIFVSTALLGWIFLIIKFAKMYRRSITCPKCGKPYNMANGSGIRLPFVRKCQFCELPINPKSLKGL
jgi:hypothetical protein